MDRDCVDDTTTGGRVYVCARLCLGSGNPYLWQVFASVPVSQLKVWLGGYLCGYLCEGCVLGTLCSSDSYGCL